MYVWVTMSYVSYNLSLKVHISGFVFKGFFLFYLQHFNCLEQMIGKKEMLQNLFKKKHSNFLFCQIFLQILLTKIVFFYFCLNLDVLLFILVTNWIYLIKFLLFTIFDKVWVF